MAIVSKKKPEVRMYTQQEILDKVLQRIDDEAESYKRTLKNCNEKLKDDYNWHFSGYADVKFKAKEMLALIKNLRGNCKIVKDKQEIVPDLFAYLKRRESWLVRDIINAKPIQSSTNPLTNLVEGWKQECWRIMLELVKDLQNQIAYRRDTIIYEGKEDLKSLLQES